MKKFFLLLSVCALMMLWLESCNNTPTSFDQVAQYKKDLATIDQYLKSNSIQATELSQGVWFINDSYSNGFRPTYRDSIKVNYKLRLLHDNTIVDQSTSPVYFTLNSLISGVQIAMPQFAKGSSGRIFIPSFYGYGNTATGKVPANSNLIFEFDLIDVIDKQLLKDTTAISFYLSDNLGIKAKIDPSGLRFTIDTVGIGAHPALTDSIQIKYTANFLLGGKLLEQATVPVKFLLSDLLLGWQIGLPIISEGGTITLYTPSSLAYGPTGSQNGVIKANTNLIFKIHLLKVIHH